MRDILPTLNEWRREGRRFALARIVATWGSSPRPVGSAMGIRDDGLVLGSVSGGCVEGAVTEQALTALQDGVPRRLAFRVSDEKSLWEAGLSCGGEIEVWVDPDPADRDPSLWAELFRRIEDDEPCVLVSDLQSAEARIEGAVEGRQSGLVESEGRELFVQVFPARERLFVVGASHIALALLGFAHGLGLQTVLIDPRSQLLTPERLSTPPDECIAAWPQDVLEDMAPREEDFAVVLSHDSRIDDSALSILLRSPVRYVGALGSRKTQEKRRADLRALGIDDNDLDRIHGPIGLDIGASTPEEIALSIAAQIVQVRHGRG